MAAPCLVFIAQTVHEALALLSKRLVVAQKVKLGLQLGALTTPDFRQRDGASKAPLRVVAGAGRLNARKLPVVTEEQQEQLAASSKPHGMQAAELFGAELQSFVDHDHVVFGHECDPSPTAVGRKGKAPAQVSTPGRLDVLYKNVRAPKQM